MKNSKKQSIFDAVKKYWYLLFGYIFMTYALTQVLISGSNKISIATDQMFAGEPVMLGQLVGPFIVLTIIGTIAAFFKRYMQNTFSVNVQVEIKNMTVKKLVKLPYSYFDENNSGSIINKLISDVYQAESLFSEVLPNFIMSIIMVIMVGVYICLINYRLFFVTLICYPLLLGLANFMSKKMGKISGNRRALYDELEDTSLDSFNGMLVGRCYSLNKIVMGRINNIIDNILKNEYIRTRISSFSLVLGNLIQWIPQVVCYVYAAYEVLNGNMTIGSLLAFAMLLDRIAHSMGDLPNAFNAIREQWVSLKRIDEIIQKEPELSGKEVFEASKDIPAISFDNVEFAYDSERKIFSNLSFDIEYGKNTAFVGSSGGGKSTVFRIMCGFYHQQKGDYKLYGHSFEEWDIKEARKQFALVSQKVFLFPGSIAENVSYGKEGTTKEDVIEACKNANIHDFIMGLPDGYDTYVGERGVKLSGGQRQRISIARAFLKGAPILLLDEPTSAIDVETEELIKKAIDKISVGKTVITIAHRLSTIENADKILVFNQGEIAESGTHEQLMKLEGVYYNLYNSSNDIDLEVEEGEAETV